MAPCEPLPRADTDLPIHRQQLGNLDVPLLRSSQERPHHRRGARWVIIEPEDLEPVDREYGMVHGGCCRDRSRDVARVAAVRG